MLFRLRIPAEGEACEGEGLYFCQGAEPGPDPDIREASLGEERVGAMRLLAASPEGRLSRLFFLEKCRKKCHETGSAIKFSPESGSSL
jgi:hypothetical protein